MPHTAPNKKPLVSVPISELPTAMSKGVHAYLPHLPSGNLTWLWKMAIEIVYLPIKHGENP